MAPRSLRFIIVRVHAAHGWRESEGWIGWREGSEVPPREEWLIAEWPDGHDEPTDYWISNLPADTPPERLARLARMRWKMELDYNSSKASSAWITTKAAPGLAGITTPRLSRLPTGSSPSSGSTLFARGRPDTPEGRAAPAAALQVLGRPLPNLSTTHHRRLALTLTRHDE